MHDDLHSNGFPPPNVFGVCVRACLCVLEGGSLTHSSCFVVVVFSCLFVYVCFVLTIQGLNVH